MGNIFPTVYSNSSVASDYFGIPEAHLPEVEGGKLIDASRVGEAYLLVWPEVTTQELCYVTKLRRSE
jgi:hypothetical protein